MFLAAALEGANQGLNVTKVEGVEEKGSTSKTVPQADVMSQVLRPLSDSEDEAHTHKIRKVTDAVGMAGMSGAGIQKACEAAAVGMAGMSNAALRELAGAGPGDDDAKLFGKDYDGYAAMDARTYMALEHLARNHKDFAAFRVARHRFLKIHEQLDEEDISSPLSLEDDGFATMDEFGCYLAGTFPPTESEKTEFQEKSQSRDYDATQVGANFFLTPDESQSF